MDHRSRPLALRLGAEYYTLPILGKNWYVWIKGHVGEQTAWLIRHAFAALTPDQIDQYGALWFAAPNGVMCDWLEEHGMPRGWRKLLRPEPIGIHDPPPSLADPMDTGIVCA